MLSTFYLRGPLYAPLRITLRLFLRYAKKQMKRIEAYLESKMKQ
jgi:hypothetical protein